MVKNNKKCSDSVNFVIVVIFTVALGLIVFATAKGETRS